MTNEQVQSDQDLLKEEAGKRSLPAFDSAIELNAASFAQVTQAYFYRLENFNKDQVQRLVFQRYYPKLVKAFETDRLAVKFLSGLDVIPNVGVKYLKETLSCAVTKMNSEVVQSMVPTPAMPRTYGTNRVLRFTK